MRDDRLESDEGNDRRMGEKSMSREQETVLKTQDDYQYGFHDEDVSVFKTKKGLTRGNGDRDFEDQKGTSVDAGFPSESL